MNADGQIELARFFIEGKKMCVADVLLPFQTAHENSARAVLFGKARFFERLVHRQQRQHCNPAQSVWGLFPDIYEPAVVTPAHREFHLGPASERTKKNRWIENLYVDVQLVHMIEP